MASLYDAVERPRVIINTNDFEPKKLADAIERKPEVIQAEPAIPAPINDHHTSKIQSVINQLFGLNDTERYQLWPEKLVRDAISAPHDVMTGQIPTHEVDPVTGEVHTSSGLIKAAQDVSALAGTGGLAGAGNEVGIALGSGPIRQMKNVEYPLAKPSDRWTNTLGQNDHRMQTMSPDEFLNKSRPLKIDAESRENIDALKQHIENGNTLDPLELHANGKEDGRHRAYAAKELGIKQVPVLNFRETKPFYSAVENALTAAKQPKADAQQWLNFLKNQPGVKQEELAHLGLDKLQGSITKDDLLKTVQEGQPQINEVIKGAKSWDSLTSQERDKMAMRYGDETGSIPSDTELKNWYNQNQKLGTKYHSYQLPGGSNYKEMLLTLPPTKNTLTEFKVVRPDGHVDSTYANAESASARAQSIGGQVQQGKTQTLDGGYKSSHWDEPNVLAHIRMNDRNIDGKKSLHLEEIQSDWHQAGRKQGYRDDRELNRLKEKASLSDISLSSIKSALDDGRLTSKEAEQLFAAKQGYESAGVPDAPFKKTWDELSIKHALTEAVKNGYDQISWTPGEAQAARYDLSKQVDSIKYLKNDDGTYNLVPFKNGKPVHSVEGENIKPEKLADIVGKEVAEKITNGHGDREAGASDIRVLSGQDLKVGGQGMKAFYDKMLVDKVNALGKKYGAKVRPSKHGEHEVWTLPITDKMKQEISSKGLPLFSMGLPIFSPVDHNPFESK